MPSDDLCYAFNLVRIPATSGASEANRLVDANKATYGRVKAAGGTLYPVSALPLSKAEWRGHFGSAFDHLKAAKQQYDPDEILTPGYDIF
jgi:cytokinin dehydrogenase